MDILIGSTRILDVVLKHSSDTLCYGVTNDSYAPGNDMLKNPDWALEAGVHTVRVRLRSANVNQTFELKFRNPHGIGPLDRSRVEM